ncbi:MAG: SMP-30/gluconolactonase/LRE family protein [Pseudomonadota bacterium]
MYVNDAVLVDPFGNFVSGAMNIDHHQFENAPMYRLHPDLTVEKILDGFHCFNGPCFNLDGSQMYVTGRTEGVIEQFSYGQGKKPQNPTVLRKDCDPDGATVDDEGFLWSAQWADACILRISPEGEIEARINFPEHIVTSVMFGGPELDLIYVTTIGDEVQEVKPKSSDAGKLLVVENSGYRGREEPPFQG